MSTTKDDIIEPLEQAEQWPVWIKKVKNRLLIKGYNFVLQASPAQQTSEIEADFAKRLDKWNEDRVKAYAEIDNVCGDIASTKLAAAKEAGQNVQQALDTLQQHFKGNVTNIFRRAKHRLLQVNILDFDNDAGKLGQEVKKLWDEIKRLSITSATPAREDQVALAASNEADPGEAFIVDCYMDALGEKYQPFVTAFFLQHSLFTETGKAKATLLDSIAAASNFKPLNPSDAFFSRRGRPSKVEYPQCSHCGKLHNPKVCYKKDPQKAPPWWWNSAGEDKKRPRSNSGRDDEDGVTIMGAAGKKREKQRYNMLIQASQTMANVVDQYAPVEKDNSPGPVGTTPFYNMYGSSQNLYNTWILDSGANGHLIGRKDVFIHMEPLLGSTSHGIGGAELRPEATGTIQLRCKLAGEQGTRLLQIPDVHYAPNAGVNLISLGKLWSSIDRVGKTSCGLTITQGRHDFSATYDNGLLTLDV